MGKVIMSGIVPQLSVPVVLPRLSDFAEGSIVKINENGSPVDFYVAKHDYESGLNGTGRTLLVRKCIYDKCKFCRTEDDNSYPGSILHLTLNTVYINRLDANIREAIRNTTIYCSRASTTNVTTMTTGIFQLSVTEFGRSNTYANVEGSTLPIASILSAITYDDNGNASYQWTRTPVSGNTSVAWCFDTKGTFTNMSAYGSLLGARPCFTLPSTTKIAEDGSVVA